MKLSCALLILLLGAVSSAQEQPSSSAWPAASSSAPRPAQVVILAELSKAVDARKAHSGDPLLARVTQEVQVGDNVVTKSSRLAGHVEQARPLAKREADSTLEIIFESVLLKDGRELCLPAFVAAIGAPVKTCQTRRRMSITTRVASPEWSRYALPWGKRIPGAPSARKD